MGYATAEGKMGIRCPGYSNRLGSPNRVSSRFADTLFSGIAQTQAPAPRAGALMSPVAGVPLASP